MNDLPNVRNFTKAWAGKTYLEGISEYRKEGMSKSDREFVCRVMREVGILDALMDGKSCMGLNGGANNRDFQTIVNYSKIFDDLSKTFLTPASFATEVVQSCRNKGRNEAAEREVCRALRAFPSFLREIDLAQILEKVCSRRGMKAEVRVSDFQSDFMEHTDIFLRIDGEQYRLWSYVNSDFARKKTARKLSGLRGELPSGIHVMCPIDLKGDCDKQHEWCFYSDRMASEILDVILSGNPSSESTVNEGDFIWRLAETCMVEIDTARLRS